MILNLRGWMLSQLSGSSPVTESGTLFIAWPMAFTLKSTPPPILKMTMRQGTLGLALAALLLGAPNVQAQAHAFLDHAQPAVGSILQERPGRVTLWFSQKLEPAFSTVIVIDQAGRQVSRDNAHLDDTDTKVLQAELKPLGPGVYTVRWRAVSADTHPTEGDFTFRVAAP